MKKLFTYIFTIFFLIINSSWAQAAEPTVTELNTQTQKVILESIDFSRIEKAVKKYEHLHSKAKWIKRLKYVAIGAGCAGVGILIFNSYFKAQETPKENNVKPDTKKETNQPDNKVIDAILERELQKRSPLGRFKEASLSALDVVVFSAVSASIWTIINKSKDVLDNQFGLSKENLDANFYRQKNVNLNCLIKQLGIFLVEHENSKSEHVSKFFDLMFADILINHTTLIRWIEDLIGFIKCTVILNAGKDSIEVASLEKDIESLSANINQFTDKISGVFNAADTQEHANLVNQATTSYLIFCKHFSKFIYDCGLYLYEDDFLQENALQENSLQN